MKSREDRHVVPAADGVGDTDRTLRTLWRLDSMRWTDETYRPATCELTQSMAWSMCCMTRTYNVRM